MNYEVGQYIKVIDSVATVCQIMNTNDILTFRGNETATVLIQNLVLIFSIKNDLRKCSKNYLSGGFEVNFKVLIKKMTYLKKTM